MTCSAEARLIIVAITGAVFGLIGYFVGSKKQRHDMEENRTDRSNEVRKDREEAGNKLEGLLMEAINIYKSNNIPSSELLLKIRQAGDRYCSRIELTSSYINNCKIDVKSNESINSNEILKALSKSIPAYYELIKDISTDLQFSFSDHNPEKDLYETFALAKGVCNPKEYEDITLRWKELARSLSENA